MSNQNQTYVGKTLNSMTSSMFQAFVDADIPKDVLDGILEHNKQPMVDYVSYLKNSDLPDKERSLRINLISWAISTVETARLLGMELVKNENMEAQLPKIQKPKGFG